MLEFVTKLELGTGSFTLEDETRGAPQTRSSMVKKACQDDCQYVGPHVQKTDIWIWSNSQLEPECCIFHLVPK